MICPQGLEAYAEDGRIYDYLLSNRLDHQSLRGREVWSIGEQQVIANEKQAEDSEHPGITLGIAFIKEHGREVEKHSQREEAKSPDHKLPMGSQGNVGRSKSDADKTDTCQYTDGSTSQGEHVLKACLPEEALENDEESCQAGTRDT